MRSPTNNKQDLQLTTTATLNSKLKATQHSYGDSITLP
jgi:hypothetical protein